MHIIANPAARNGRGEKHLRLVTGALDEENITYTLSRTSNPGDAALIARKAADSGEDLVLCVGGDGTVSEVAAGLAGSATALGIIPAGTGDDFARYLGIPQNPLEALDIAASGVMRTVDAASANDRVFINVAGSGFDVAVLRQTLRYKKFFYGIIPYILGVLSAVFGYGQMRLTVSRGGETISQKSLLLSVANGRYMGGGMCVAPTADADDGLFDVIYVDELARWKIPFLLAAFIKGKHMNWPVVHHFRCDEFTVTASDASLQLDGEIFEEQTVRYKILPGAVKVMVPAPGVAAKPRTHAESLVG